MDKVFFKFVAVLWTTVLLAGCGHIGPPIPPSLELPKPVTNLRAVRKGDQVFLSWSLPSQTTERQSIRHWGPALICRSVQVPMDTCGNPIGQIPAEQFLAGNANPSQITAEKALTTFVDALPHELQQVNPTGEIAYSVSATNSYGRSAGLSNQVQVPAAPVLAPPEDFKAQVTVDGVELSWKAVPHQQDNPALRFLYRVYRRSQSGNADVVAGEVPLDASETIQFTDHAFEWEKTYDYRVTVVTLVAREGKPELQVEGSDTSALQVFAHDIFPPSVPTGLQAVFSGVGQQAFVDLIWAPDTEADLAGYNIYRREEGGSWAKINSDVVKTPAYRDGNVQSSKRYFYSVSGVDLRGNESGRSEEASEAVP